jgi:hypothetical protein
MPNWCNDWCNKYKWEDDKEREKVREKLAELTYSTVVLAWTVLVCGAWAVVLLSLTIMAKDGDIGSLGAYVISLFLATLAAPLMWLCGVTAYAWWRRRNG